MAIHPSRCYLVAVFAKNLREHRERAGLSQEALAEKAEVHRTYIGMLERGEKNATLYNVERMAKALGVGPAELMAGWTPAGPNPPTRKKRRVARKGHPAP